MDAARGGDTIVVCPGTYRELVHLTKNGLTLRAATPWTASRSIMLAKSPCSRSIVR